MPRSTGSAFAMTRSARTAGITPTIVELDRDGVCHDHLLGLPASDRSV